MPDIKKSVVSDVKFKKKGTSQFGDAYYFTVTFENGDSGDYAAKQEQQNKFVVGKEVEYVIDTKVNGTFTNSYIKLAPGAAGFGGGFRPNEKAMNARTALSNAVLLASTGIIKTEQIKGMAVKYLEWLTENSKE